MTSNRIKSAWLNLLKKINETIWVKAFIINTFLLIVLISLFEPTEKIDDYEMRNMLYGGAIGEYCPFLLYSDVLFGKILVFLISTIPGIDWYWCVHYILIFISMFCFIFFLLKKNYSVYVIMPVIIIIGFECYIRCTFSKTAGVLICAGLLMISAALLERALNLKLIIDGLIFIIVGTMIRREILLLGVFVSGGTLIIYLLENGIKKNLYIIKCAAGLFLALITIYIAGKCINNYELANNKDWLYHVKTQESISRLYDYGIPNYGDNEEIYKDLGISYNDTIVWFDNLNICDVDRITGDICTSITEIKNEQDLEKTLKNKIKSLLPNIAREPAFFVFLLAYIFLFIYEREHDKNSRLIFWLVPLFALIINLYLGRLNHHIAFCIWIMSAFAMMCFYPCRDILVLSKKKLICLMCFVTLVNFNKIILNHGYTHGDWFERSEEKSLQDTYNTNKALFEYLGKNDGNIYMVETKDLYDIYPCFTPFQVIDKGIYSNIFLMHDAHRVPGIELRRRYGMENVFDYIVDGNVYYINTPKYGSLISVVAYLKEHYCENVEAVLVEKTHGVEIYKFVSSGK